jgi:hypothetical protein
MIWAISSRPNPWRLNRKRLDDVDHDALRELIDRSARVHKGIDRPPS